MGLTQLSKMLDFVLTFVTLLCCIMAALLGISGQRFSRVSRITPQTRSLLFQTKLWQSWQKPGRLGSLEIFLWVFIMYVFFHIIIRSVEK